jgi:hypothetical protein
MMVDTMSTQKVTAVPGQLGVTVRLETLGYVVLATLGAVLRLFELGWYPLDPREAALALPAWQAAAGQPFGVVPGSPLLFQLQQLTFWLVHGGDALARLVPALAGVLLILAAAGLRPLIGRPAALATAAIFALSPAWVFFGRNVSPTTLSALWIVLLLGLLARGGPRARLWAPIVTGLLVVSGGMALTFALAMVAGWVVLRLSPRGRWMLDALAGLWSEPTDRRRAALLFGGTVALAATGLMLRPEGFAALLQLPAAWAQAVATSTGPQMGLVLPLLAYAPVTLLFGLVGLLLAWRRSAFGRVLAVWALIGGLAAMLAGPATFPDFLLPLTLAAGIGLGRLARSVSRNFQWREEGLMTVILLVVASYLLLTAFAAVSIAQGFEVAQKQLLLASVVLLLLVAVYWFLWGGFTTLRVLGLSWIIIGTLMAWSGGTALNYRRPIALAEPLRPTFVTPDGARLAADLVAVSRTRERDPDALSVVADPALQAALAWPLRGMRQQRWAIARGQITEDAVIVPGTAPVSEGEPSFGPAPYLGREYLVSGSFFPNFLSGTAGDPWLLLRWFLTREPVRDATLGGAVQFDKASLYLKADDEVIP